MAGHVSLANALERLGSRGLKERSEALSDLEHVLRHNKRSQQLASLGNASLHSIFEALFSTVLSDKAIYIRAKTGPTKASTAKRLSSCAATLRLAVEVGLKGIRSKTVRALLDHLTETFTSSTGEICEPIALDFSKCLNSLFTYRPHVEHLTGSMWEAVVSFSIQQLHGARNEAETGSETDLSSRSMNAGHTDHKSFRTHLRDSSGSQGSHALTKQIADEMVGCIHKLTQATNAPVTKKAPDLLGVLVEFLRNNSITISSLREAFAAVNNVLGWTVTEDIRLTKRMTSQLIKLSRHHWQSKSAAVKDQILICLTQLRPFIKSLMSQNDALELRPELDGLLAVFNAEYTRRQEKDQLSLDDLRFGLDDTDIRTTGTIETETFSLRASSVEAERNWTLLSLLSFISDEVLKSTKKDKSSEDEYDNQQSGPRKRPRKSDQMADLLDLTISSKPPARIASLQCLAFLGQQKSFPREQILLALETLLQSCSDDHAGVSSWAFVAIASFATQSASSSMSLINTWASMWQLSIGSMSNSSTCRAACHLLNTLLRRNLIAESTVAQMSQILMSSSNLSGPVLLTDSSLRLLQNTIRVSSTSLPASVPQLSERALDWLFVRWRPSKFDDRQYISTLAALGIHDIVSFVACCIGQPCPPLLHAEPAVWHSVALSLLRAQKRSELLSYLLLLPEADIYLRARTSKSQAPILSTQENLALSRASAQSQLLTHLSSEVTNTTDLWKRSLQERTRSVSLEIFSNICSSCIISSCIANGFSFVDERRATALDHRCTSMFAGLESYLVSPHCGEDDINPLVHLSMQVLPVSSADQWEEDHTDRSCQTQKLITDMITRVMSARRTREVEDLNGDESMRVDDQPESQDSRDERTNSDQSASPDVFAAGYSFESLKDSTCFYASMYARGYLVNRREALSSDTSAEIVDYLISLPMSSVLTSSKVLARMFRSHLGLTHKDAARLFAFLSQVFDRYEYNRSELALSPIVDLMSCTISMWTDSSHEVLYDYGLDMYEWFTSVALTADVLSPGVQQSVASLLLDLCSIDTDYGAQATQSSARTSLFRLLQVGCITVKFQLADRISTVFGLFVLSKHSEMFLDLQGSLTKEMNWTEGIAIRLRVLAQLAASWHSLLRQCVYYIFETAGSISTSKNHAASCMSSLASSLKFNSSRRIFELFSPQLLYTWLDGQHLSDLPYEIFDYSSLADLLAGNQGEIIAQLFLRDSDEGFDLMSTTLRSSRADLVRESFGKVYAYAMSWDISNPPTGTDTLSCENRLRSLVGSKEELKHMIRQEYPAILGQFFLSMQGDDDEDRWLEKRESYAVAAATLAEIKKYGHLTRSLPMNQQPHFKNKYLPDQIERLARRLSPEASQSLWDASSFTLAARMLLDTIDAALGPLHICAVIRKLRLLTAMAGEIPLGGYQLEMLLRCLLPFLADSQCADDALGLIHYLFLRGSAHLSDSLHSLCGLALHVVLRMNKHMSMSQEKTTQESQRKETLQRMHQFRVWLTNYLRRLQKGATKFAQEMETILASLINLEFPWHAQKDNAASTLLLLLLRQRDCHEPLLQAQDVNEALEILAENFELHESLSADGLMNDKEAMEYAKPLWYMMQQRNINEQFVLWASVVVGRAYAATGMRTTYLATDDFLSPLDSARQHQGSARSQYLIAKQMALLVNSSTLRKVSIGEHTVRACLSSFAEPLDALAFEKLLPDTHAITFSEGTFGYVPPGIRKPFTVSDKTTDLHTVLDVAKDKGLSRWAADVAILICQTSRQALLKALPLMLHNIEATAVHLLPSIAHLVLLEEVNHPPILQTALASSLTAHFSDEDPSLQEKQRYLIQLLLYLRSQPYPGEATRVDRLRWLPCDHLLAAQCAARCGMPSTSLMLAELSQIIVPSHRRASSRTTLSQLPSVIIPDELLLSVFQQIDEPDSYYGVQQPASLESVLKRLEHEGHGFKALMFRSAQMDRQMRESHQFGGLEAADLVSSLSSLNLSSITFALASANKPGIVTASDAMLDSARNLQQWDLAIPETSNSDAARLFKGFQCLSHSAERATHVQALHKLIIQHVQESIPSHSLRRPSHKWLNVIGALTNILEITSCSDPQAVLSNCERISARQQWMDLSPFDDFQTLVQSRSTLLSVIAANKTLMEDLHVTRKDLKILEGRALLSASDLARRHDRLQDAASAVTQASSVATESLSIGVSIESAVKREVASVLWHAGEHSASVKLLRDTILSLDVRTEDIEIGRSGVLAQLGQQLAEARLEKPADILQNYLKPAISGLQRQEGQEAGTAFYAFASFCDQQLQNSAALEDFNRISKLRQGKLDEIEQLETLLKSSKRTSSEKNPHEFSLKKARQWFNIDNDEYQRLKQSRDTFMQQSLQNYLRALHASEEHDICVLRFFAMWLENADSRAANDAASKYLPEVPSWKFVLLMNQLMSRLKYDKTAFQKALMELVFRVCREHQYHTVHHLYANRRSSNKDEAAKLRATAAAHICKQLEATKQKDDILSRMLKADSLYRMLAEEPNDGRRSGKYNLKDSPYAYKVSRYIPQERIPPATFDLPLQPDAEYRDVPTVASFSNSIHIMTGLSAPKVLTATASNGLQYKQLFKGGNDDLRQDAIMEQVFGEVSKMLRNHKATRQRNLHVRTYKVIPLTNKSGIIEFVPNSIPINEFLQPAHQKYSPGSMRPSTAREKIHAVAGNSTETRVKEYRKVCEQMPPVMRHFFFERFDNPDDWFEKRTAYTRTTATISMLGQVLGLGDRHCHNILLDEKSGEVVHIDLGVAFEAGRVLPIPELVPFRLTRDIVDGMGVTGTEGVFQRCCEFTLDALREDKDSIMTLLNVLRYDPLYTWTLSPLRAKRMQEQEGEANGSEANGAEAGSSKNKEEEDGEADRALSIVEKKLGTTLSTAATVSELIQQARDERNLATLFNGWAAFF